MAAPRGGVLPLPRPGRKLRPDRQGLRPLAESPAPDYSIVIPAFDEERLLPTTLARLREAMATTKTDLAGEVVVCDNNSTDRTATIAAESGARVVFEPINQISRARNTGARAARGRFLVFVDADTVVPPRLLDRALSALSDGGVCGGGSEVVMEGASGLVSGLVAFWNALARWRRLAAGSFLFVRRDGFEAVGGFSEAVYASEEIWLSRAVARWGRARHLAFEILRGDPVLTSGRKADWYPTPLLVGMAVLFALVPLAVRSRRLCWLWHRRPRAL